MRRKRPDKPPPHSHSDCCKDQAEWHGSPQSGCYRCEEPDHIAYRCPTPPTQNQPAEPWWTPGPPRPPSPRLSVLHSGFASLPSLVLRVVLVFVEECRRPGKTRIIKPFCYHAFKCKGPGDSDVINCHGFFKGADSK